MSTQENNVLNWAKSSDVPDAQVLVKHDEFNCVWWASAGSVSACGLSEEDARANLNKIIAQTRGQVA